MYYGHCPLLLCPMTSVGKLERIHSFSRNSTLLTCIQTQQALLPEGGLVRQSLEFFTYTFPTMKMPLPLLWITPNCHGCLQLLPLPNVKAGRGDQVSPLKGSAT